MKKICVKKEENDFDFDEDCFIISKDEFELEKNKKREMRLKKILKDLEREFE